jgi:hypothetical protein
MAGRPVHPGQDQPGLGLLGEALELGAGQQVDRPAEPEDPAVDVQRPQRRFAVGVGADGGRLGNIGPRQGRQQMQEIGFRPAFAGRPKEVKHAHRARTLAGETLTPKHLEDREITPYNPRLAERRGWVAQLVRAEDS